MKLLKFTGFLFYKYYSTGPTRRVPYLSTLCALSMILYMHLFQILILINRVDEFVPLEKDDDKGIKYLKMALFFTPIFLLLTIIVKKKELDLMHFESTVIKRGYIFLILYIVVSFAALIFLILYKKGKI